MHGAQFTMERGWGLFTVACKGSGWGGAGCMVPAQLTMESGWGSFIAHMHGWTLAIDWSLFVGLIMIIITN